LRVGGAPIIISQGPPMWLADSAWSQELRAYLEKWTGEPVRTMCGTDRATLDQRARGLRGCGYERVEVFEYTYQNEVDLTYVAGHLRSAMSESTLPPQRAAEFQAGLNDALRPHLEHGPLIERIEATALIGIAHTPSLIDPYGHVVDNMKPKPQVTASGVRARIARRLLGLSPFPSRPESDSSSPFGLGESSRSAAQPIR
jgi:hypothetical protein